MSDIDSAVVAFLLLDQCEIDRTTLTKGVADLTEAVELKDFVINSAREDSLLQAQMIGEYILQVKDTEKLFKKEVRKKKLNSVLHYTVDAVLVGLLAWTIFSK